jgi:cytochrome c553
MLAIALTLALLVAPGCSSGSKTTASTTSNTSSTGVSYSRDIQPLFNSYCVVCHQGVGQAGLTLEPNLSYSKLVGVPSTESATELRVKAGAPDQSYLLAKLNGTQVQAGGSGVQMPYGAAPLSQAQISLIQQWIAAAALNN